MVRFESRYTQLMDISHSKIASSKLFTFTKMVLVEICFGYSCQEFSIKLCVINIFKHAKLVEYIQFYQIRFLIWISKINSRWIDREHRTETFWIIKIETLWEMLKFSTVNVKINLLRLARETRTYLNKLIFQANKKKSKWIEQFQTLLDH